MRALLVAALLALVGCQLETHPAPIPNSTYRIGEDEPAQGGEVTVDILTTADECANALIDDTEACVPRVDRASGELRLSFLLRDPITSRELKRSIRLDTLQVTQDRSRQTDLELVPHDPTSAGQLFILLIDGSGSMYENDGERVKKVYQALLARDVVDGFFPKGNNKTGVMLVRFTDKLEGLDGGAPRVITSPKAYKDMVQQHLMRRSGGYTYLYRAVREALSDLLRRKQVDRFIKEKIATPTVVLLTDGFNNEAATDTCRDNAPRLQETLDAIKKIRKERSGDMMPTVYTVGLGRQYRPGQKPDGRNQAVTPQALCGRFADNLIDAREAGQGLEDVGIDHVSLAWLAEAGGGVSFVKRNPKGLAEVFQTAAAARYRWYQLHYRVPDNFYHRKSFETEINVLAYNRAFTKVKLYPSPLLDTPTGFREPGARWVTKPTYRATFSLLMPLLGFLVVVSFLGAATFNARRALFRRAPPKKR